jgi:regulatory protein
MRITDIVRQKKRSNRLSIFLDGAFAFGLNDETAFNHGLKTGLELDEDQIARMLEEDQRKRAKDAAFHYLSFRPRTISEVRKKLREKDYEETIIQETIALLERLGLLDDRDFASRWIAERLRLKPRGRRLLFVELIKKGISREMAEEELSETFANVDERTLAADLLRKKAARTRTGDSRQAFRKMRDFLIRKGFDFEVAREVAEEMVGRMGKR